MGMSEQDRTRIGMSKELWAALVTCSECRMYNRGEVSLCPDHAEAFAKELPHD